MYPITAITVHRQYCNAFSHSKVIRQTKNADYLCPETVVGIVIVACTCFIVAQRIATIFHCVNGDVYRCVSLNKLS